jgi:WD40 repeat protein
LLFLWDLESGALLRHLESAEGPVYTLSFGPDSQRIFGSTLDSNSVFVRDVETGDTLHSLVHDDAVSEIFMMPDSERILVGTVNGIITLWDIQSSERLSEFNTETESAISRLSTTADGKLVAVSVNDDYPLFLILQDNQFEITGGPPEENWAEFILDDQSPTGQLYLMGNSKYDDDYHYHVYIFDPEDGNTQEIETYEGLFTDYSAQSHRALSASDNNLMIYAQDIPIEPNEFIDPFEINLRYMNQKGHLIMPDVAAFSPDGYRLTTGDGDSKVFVWDAETGDMVRKLEGHNEALRDLQYSPDGQWLATNDGMIRIWGTEDLFLTNSFSVDSQRINAIAWDPDSSLLVAGTVEGSLILWVVESGGTIWHHDLHKGSIDALAIQQDGKLIASGGNSSVINVWNADDGTHAYDLAGHASDITAIAFHESENVLVSGAADGEIIFWDLSTQQATRRYSSNTRVARIFSDDEVITSMSDRNYIEWQYQDLDQLKDWVCKNRVIVQLSDDQRRHFRIEDAIDPCIR